MRFRQATVGAGGSCRRRPGGLPGRWAGAGEGGRGRVQEKGGMGRKWGRMREEAVLGEEEGYRDVC